MVEFLYSETDPMLVAVRKVETYEEYEDLEEDEYTTKEFIRDVLVLIGFIPLGIIFGYFLCCIK